MLLVEGNDDKHVIFALCEHYQIPETFEVKVPKDAGAIEDGDSQVLQTLQTNLEEISSDIDIIGVVLDTDADLMRRWNQISRILQKAKEPYQIPSQPDPLGTIIASAGDKTPRLGFWLMPNNQLTGKLEDFVGYLIPTDDNLAPAVEHSLQHIEQNQWQKYAEKERIKATIHTWLAWQEEPGIPMGRAITRKFLTPNTPTSGQFANWLTNLFS